MIQMKHDEYGLHMMPDGAVEEAMKEGWVEVEKVAKPIKSDIVTPQISAEPRRAGRPRKEVPSILNDGEI